MLAESCVVAWPVGSSLHSLSSSLHDFSVRQKLDAEFGRIKAGQIKRLKMAQKNPRLWTRVRLMYSSVRVAENKASVDLVLNAPEDLLNQAAINTMQRNVLKRSKDLGLEDVDLNVSVIPNRVFQPTTSHRHRRRDQLIAEPPQICCCLGVARLG